MANLPIIIPGLAIPDPNFIWPIGDSWERLSGMAATSYRQLAEHYNVDTMPGTGKVLRVSVGEDPAAGGLTDGLLSAPTPLNVMAGVNTWASHTISMWVGCIVKTSGIEDNNGNDLIKFQLNQYDSSGVIEPTPTTFTLDEPNALRDNVSNYTLYWKTQLVTIETDTVEYRLLMYFDNDSHGGVNNYLYVPWVGCGHVLEVSSPRFSSWYTADASTSSNNLRRQVSSRGRMNPHIFVQDQGAHAQTVNVSFPLLTEADKRKITLAWTWNAGTPTAGINQSTNRIANRGTSQPVLVALDRDNIKKAFYADFASPPVFTQATPGWWPDASPVWSTSLTFTERLF